MGLSLDTEVLIKIIIVFNILNRQIFSSDTRNKKISSRKQIYENFTNFFFYRKLGHSCEVY